MPFVTEYSDGARFTARVRSSLASNRRVRWYNTFEVRSTDSGTTEDIAQLAANLCTFVVNIAYNYVYVDECTVSTWEEDSHPYNPLGFLTYNYNTVGVKSLGGDSAMPLRQTLFLKRVVESGLQGKLFLRGALSLPDVEYTDGDWGLDNPGGLQSNVNTAITTSDIGDYLLGIDSIRFGIVMMGPAGSTRFVTNFQVEGTSDVKLNHKYFDRS